MAKYIDKNILVAEIERLKCSLSPNFYEYDYDAAKVELLEKIEEFLNTLEVKEVEEITVSDKHIADVTVKEAIERKIINSLDALEYSDYYKEWYEQQVQKESKRKL